MFVFIIFFLNDCMYIFYDLFCIIVCFFCIEIFDLSEKFEFEFVKYINMFLLILWSYEFICIICYLF